MRQVDGACSLAYEKKYSQKRYSLSPQISSVSLVIAGKNRRSVLHTALMTQGVNWALDVDVRKFFDWVDHEWLLRMIAHRIVDPRVLRLIRRWLKAGVLEGGEWHEVE